MFSFFYYSRNTRAQWHVATSPVTGRVGLHPSVINTTPISCQCALTPLPVSWNTFSWISFHKIKLTVTCSGMVKSNVVHLFTDGLDRGVKLTCSMQLEWRPMKLCWISVGRTSLALHASVSRLLRLPTFWTMWTPWLLLLWWSVRHYVG